jgi:dTDP-4-dehydrorhamnose reductase
MTFTSATKVLITGCGGMLGEAVYGTFAPIADVRATDIDLTEPWLSRADVRDNDQMAGLVRQVQPDIIMNLAALTDMEFCETHQDEAWRTNGLAAEHLAVLAAERNAVYVYVSTAGIFDGKKEFYGDTDEPNPVSQYAKSKYHGEISAVRCAPRHFVVRAGWMMGGGPRKDKKFVNKIYQQILSGHRELNVVSDKAGTPTYTWDFARGIQRLIESDRYGVYNQVCEGAATRYDVAVEFVRLLGLGDQVKINEVSSDFFRKDYFAPRPPSEQLINEKLTAQGLNVMRHWRECLRDYSKVFVTQGISPLLDLRTARS